MLTVIFYLSGQNAEGYAFANDYEQASSTCSRLPSRWWKRHQNWPQKLGQPVPLSNLVLAENNGKPNPEHR